MDNNLFEEQSIYKKFLNLLEKRISEKDFEKYLIEVQKIDLKHYNKKISIRELKEYIEEYRKLENINNEIKNLQILLPGNPEIVFKVCLEAIRYDVNMLICIEDFCLAQNIFIVKMINEIIQEYKFKNKIEIRNLQKDKEIIENSKSVERTICIGNTNLYNRLENKLENFIFNPYGIMDMYSDSEKFEELKRTIYDYAIQNQFELEIYDDLDFENALKAINRDGYGFCTLLLSNDENKINEFTQKVNSKSVIINKNPFKEMKFILEF